LQRTFRQFEEGYPAMNDKQTADTKKVQEASLNFEIKEDGPAKYRELMRKNQKLPMGVVGGVAGALIGNAVWIGVFLIGYKIDFLALCVGFFIGYCVRYLGKGVEPKFGYAAGVIAFFSTMLAYFTIGCILFARVNHIGFLSVFTHMNVTTALFLIKGVIGFLDVLFLLGATGLAYYYSFKPLKEF
jgi:hypothetical protein